MTVRNKKLWRYIATYKDSDEVFLITNAYTKEEAKRSIEAVTGFTVKIIGRE